MPQRSFTQEHTWQRVTVGQLAAEGYTPILNIACKEDPAGLADFGATNLDIQQFDPSLGVDLTKQVPNFVHGDACNLPFPEKSFRLTVHGEFIEHCEFDKAVEALSSAKRVLADDGRMVLSFPLDPRPLEAQHSPPVFTEFVKGCWAGHVTVWDEALREKLYAKVGLEEVRRDYLRYVLGGICLSGRGLILKKK